MARRKIIFVIVEGPSDEDALGLVMNEIFDKDTVYVHVMRRDITSQYDVEPSNILSKIGNEVRTYAKVNYFRKGDFKRIIHVVDMDGAFVSEKAVVEDNALKKAQYTLTAIRTPNRAGIIDRNRRKGANLSKISTHSEIWGIPYGVFYMSCNLEHILYDKMNLSDPEKESHSHAFAKKYKGRAPQFMKFITKSNFSRMEDYMATWEFIKQDLHSLERHSNLGLCFKET